MPQINYLAILAATIGAFVLSGIWYAVFGDAMKRAQANPEQQTKMSPWQIGAELARSAVVALVLGYLLSRLQIVDHIAHSMSTSSANSPPVKASSVTLASSR